MQHKCNPARVGAAEDDALSARIQKDLYIAPDNAAAP